MSQQINLSVIEENPTPMPEDVQNLSLEALQIIWQTSHDIATKEIKAASARYQKFEAEVLQQRQEALDKVAKTNKEIAAAKATIENFTRENKSLQVDINRKIGELKTAEGRAMVLEDKLAQREHETKYLNEEVGHVRENAEELKKRLYECNRQSEQDNTALLETREDLAVNINNRERLQKELNSAKQEAAEIWKQLKLEQRQTAVAEALVQEMREANKKSEAEIKLLKEEKQDIKAALENEVKGRVGTEKRIAVLNARMESQEVGYRETISRLEQDLVMNKSEVVVIRNRMIKAEASFEREKKALERLETKMVAASGGKPNL